jgi:hypothetical protein
MPTPNKPKKPNLLRQFQQWMNRGKNLVKEFDQMTYRALQAFQVYEKIWQQLDYDEWLIDLFLDTNRIMVIILGEGANLYMADVTINGDEVVLGDRVRVTQTFEEVSTDGDETEDGSERIRLRAQISIHRQADGQVRWMLRACTAFLNRVGELDTSALFRTFVDRFKEAQNGNESYPIPFFTVRHKGTMFRMGDADFVGVDGYILLMSGLFDEDNELAERAAIALERDDEGYFGVSIGYRLEIGDAMPELVYERVRTEDGTELIIPIPAFTEGTLVEGSLLREADAASLFTTSQRMEVSNAMPQQRKNRIDDGTYKDLLKIFDGDEEALEDYLEENAEINSRANERGVIAREKKEATAKEKAKTIGSNKTRTGAQVKKGAATNDKAGDKKRAAAKPATSKTKGKSRDVDPDDEDDEDGEDDPDDEDEDDEEIEVNLDKAAIKAIAQELKNDEEFMELIGAGAGGERSSEKTIKTLRTKVANLTREFADMSAQFEALMEQMDEDDEDHEDDLPAHSSQRKSLRVGVRPRDRVRNVGGNKKDSAHKGGRFVEEDELDDEEIAALSQEILEEIP